MSVQDLNDRKVAVQQLIADIDLEASSDAAYRAIVVAALQPAFMFQDDVRRINLPNPHLVDRQKQRARLAAHLAVLNTMTDIDGPEHLSTFGRVANI